MQELKNESHHISTTEIDIVTLFKIFFEKKNLIIIVASGFLALTIGIVYALSLENQYRASALLTSNHSESNQLDSIAKQYSGLATLAGINVGSSGNDSLVNEATTVLKSWNFIDKFIQKRDIAVQVYAADSWNRQQNKIILDKDLFDAQSNKWVRDFDASKGEAPTPSSWELYEKFSENLAVSLDLKTSFVTIAYTHVSPHFAQQVVQWLITDINDEFKMRKINSVELNIKYLNTQIENTSKSELQTVFFNLIEEQYKQEMLAKANKDFVFKTLNPPMLPEQKDSPKRSLIVIIFGFLGGFFSLAYISIVNRKRIVIQNNLL